jgi:hypothetical protein
MDEQTLLCAEQMNRYNDRLPDIEAVKATCKMSFDPQIAKDVGVEEAIMYSNIEFWCDKNEANDKHFFDGYYWSYNSIKAFSRIFPFWTGAKIKRILNKLKEQGYIVTGKYNKSNYDKTTWYSAIYRKSKKELSNEDFRKKENAFCETSQSIRRNQPIDEVKPANRLGETNQPIPDNKQQINKQQINKHLLLHNKQATPESYGKEDINWLLAEFQRIMQFKSAGQKDRIFANHLIKNFTREQLSVMLQYCSKEEYAPRVGSIEKLWYKRGDIIAGLRALKNKQENKIAFIS